MFSGRQCRQCHWAVQIRPCANNHGVNVSRLNQLFPMLADSRNAELFGDSLGRLVAAITDADNLDTGLRLEVRNMTAARVRARAHHANADSGSGGHDLYKGELRNRKQTDASYRQHPGPSSRTPRHVGSNSDQAVHEGTTAFVKLQILSTHTSMTSPGFKYCGGFIPKPTPGGVPVKIMSPGSRVT